MRNCFAAIFAALVGVACARTFVGSVSLVVESANPQYDGVGITRNNLFKDYFTENPMGQGFTPTQMFLYDDGMVCWTERAHCFDEYRNTLVDTHAATYLLPTSPVALTGDYLTVNGSSSVFYLCNPPGVYTDKQYSPGFGIYEAGSIVPEQCEPVKIKGVNRTNELPDSIYYSPPSSSQVTSSATSSGTVVPPNSRTFGSGEPSSTTGTATTWTNTASLAVSEVGSAPTPAATDAAATSVPTTTSLSGATDRSTPPAHVNATSYVALRTTTIEDCSCTSTGVPPASTVSLPVLNGAALLRLSGLAAAGAGAGALLIL